MANIRLGDVLIEQGLINNAQLGDALKYQKEHTDLRLGACLVEMGFVSEEEVIRALANKFNMEIADFSDIEIDINVVRQIPENVARKYNVIAIGEEEDALVIALDDPINYYAIEDVRSLVGKRLIIKLATASVIKNAINYYYTEVSAYNAAESANKQIEEIQDIVIEDLEDEAPVIKLVNTMIQRAYGQRASDIHIEPFEKKTYVRMRIDGVMNEFVTLNKSITNPLITRIKILANLDIAEKRIPQDGHFKVRVEDCNLNIRVSILPTVFGEKAVLRLLGNKRKVDGEKTFGMRESDYLKVKKMLEAPHGIIYLTGPTGSGKTTTLYMMLESLLDGTKNISTIEDPVEKNIDRINQTQVNNQAGMTFESGLRALLRQDPDIIMVGETRDNETASISVRASITGHLVLSTLHTNSACDSIVRLEDMGVEPYLLASSLTGIISQRLMRKVCPYCAVLEEPTVEEKVFLPSDVFKVKHAKGCARCNNTGYSGRMSVHEVLVVDSTIRKMISDRTDIDEIENYAIKNQGMKRIKQSAIDLIKEGISTVDELKKITFFND